MFERFAKEAKAVVRQAELEARLLGSRTIEREHLLLAASGRVGLDRDELLEAFEDERRESLARVGVEIELPPQRPIGVAPRFGTSAKAALAGALRNAEIHGDRRIGPRHVARGAIGGMGAIGSPVRRALELADVDTSAVWQD